MLVSIFNDVIGPVMRGPSSSHCAAALRIGRLARDLMSAQFEEVLVEFDRQGSLPTTHASQGSDMGLFGGLLGWDASDERLPASAETLAAQGVRVRIETVDAGDPHPNTYRLTLRHGETAHRLRAISTGGGMIEVISIDEIPVSLFGDGFVTLLWTFAPAAVATHLQAELGGARLSLQQATAGPGLCVIQTDRKVPVEQWTRLVPAGLLEAVVQLQPVLPVLTRSDSRALFTSAEALQQANHADPQPLWRQAMRYEMARGGLSEEEVLARMLEIVRILRRSIAQGVAGTSYEDRILGHQSGRFAERMRQGQLLPGGPLQRVVLYVTALMEVKSAMGVIVAAPTAGACAALPGAVIALAEEMGLDESAMARALLASGLIGVFIAAQWTFAAEVGGCQAEGGAAACMAAAALVTLADGSLSQALAASSLALQSMIGLVCDPVANRVEVPCLGKNVMAASHALSCANMALADFDPVIPLDEVIATARQVAAQMPRELRCTALGGLSVTPTSLALEKKLAARQSCGGKPCASSPSGPG